VCGAERGRQSAFVFVCAVSPAGRACCNYVGRAGRSVQRLRAAQVFERVHAVQLARVDQTYQQSKGTLEALASAHGVTLDAYLRILAERLSDTTPRRSAAY
jgi:hypothetical protein